MAGIPVGLFICDVAKINSDLTASDGEQFRYGKDANGNRGVIVRGDDGADTVIPFSGLITPLHNKISTKAYNTAFSMYAGYKRYKVLKWTCNTYLHSEGYLQLFKNDGSLVKSLDLYFRTSQGNEQFYQTGIIDISGSEYRECDYIRFLCQTHGMGVNNYDNYIQWDAIE